MAATQPFLHFSPSPATVTDIQDPSEDNAEDKSIQSDVRDIVRLCDLIYAERNARKDSGRGVFDGARYTHGPDLMVQIQSGLAVPIHRVVLSARCPALDRLASGIDKTTQDRDTNIVIKAPLQRVSVAEPNMAMLTITGCQPLSVLILLTYLYSDNVLALWDPRIASMVDRQVRSATRISPDKVKAEIQVLARILDLPCLTQILDAPVKKTPTPTIAVDFRRILYESQHNRRHNPDVILDLADRQVFCHSLLLRARSPLFAAFFDDEDWTTERWGADGTILVNLRHLRWREMEFVIRFMCCGDDQEMFNNLGEP